MSLKRPRTVILRARECKSEVARTSERGAQSRTRVDDETVVRWESISASFATCFSHGGPGALD